MPYDQVPGGVIILNLNIDASPCPHIAEYTSIVWTIDSNDLVFDNFSGNNMDLVEIDILKTNFEIGQPYTVTANVTVFDEAYSIAQAYIQLIEGEEEEEEDIVEEEEEEDIPDSIPPLVISCLNCFQRYINVQDTHFQAVFQD